MNTITRCGFAALVVAVSLDATAAPPAGKQCERTWTGTLTAVDAQGSTVTVKRAWLARKFNLGEHCAIVAIDEKKASLADLSPGEKVTICYQNAEGVRVADRIAEAALHYGGTVHSVDANARTLTMEEAPLTRPFHAPEKFRLASKCRVTLWNGHEGTLSQVQPGDRISVTYELPGGTCVAYRIQDKSSLFVGAVEAIDLSDGTVKAKELYGEKNFDLARHCQIVIPGRKAGHLKDLVLGRRYQFTYQNVNGVNVLDRIAAAQEERPAETASARQGPY